MSALSVKLGQIVRVKEQGQHHLALGLVVHAWGGATWLVRLVGAPWPELPTVLKFHEVDLTPLNTVEMIAASENESEVFETLRGWWVDLYSIFHGVEGRTTP